MSIFERATRAKLGFASAKGVLQVQDLWDLPLSSKSGMDLDTLAIAAHRELKAMTEESFVATSTNPAKPAAELRLEVLKHIIGVKMAENQAKTDAAMRKAQREQLQAALERKDAAAIDGLSTDELKARIAALS